MTPKVTGHPAMGKSVHYKLIDGDITLGLFQAKSSDGDSSSGDSSSGSGKYFCLALILYYPS